MRRQVWDTLAGREAGAMVIRDEDGQPCLIRPLSPSEVARLLNDGSLVARRPDACQDPIEDLLERPPVRETFLRVM